MLVYFIKAQTKIADQPGMVLYGTPPRWHKFNPAVHTDKDQLHYHAKKATEIKAAKELAAEHAGADQQPKDHVAALQAKAKAIQDKASASAAVTGFKQAMLAGKAPTVSQAKAYHSLAQSQPEKAAKLLESILDAIGQDKYQELMGEIGAKLVEASKAKPKAKAKPEDKPEPQPKPQAEAKPDEPADPLQPVIGKAYAVGMGKDVPRDGMGLVQCHFATQAVAKAIDDKKIALPPGTPVKVLEYDEDQQQAFNSAFAKTPKPEGLTSDAAKNLLVDLADKSVNGHSLLKIGDQYVDPHLKSGGASQAEINKVGAFFEKVYAAAAKVKDAPQADAKPKPKQPATTPAGGKTYDQVKAEFYAFQDALGPNEEYTTLDDLPDDLANDPHKAAMAALAAFSSGGFMEINDDPNHFASKALLNLIRSMQPDKSKAPLHRVVAFESKEEQAKFVVGLAGDWNHPGVQTRTLSSWSHEDPAAPGKTGINNISLDLAGQFGSHRVFMTLEDQKSARDISFIYGKNMKPGTEQALPKGTRYEVISTETKGKDVHVKLREVQEGDTKTVNGVTYILENGRWHRATPEDEAAPTASVLAQTQSSSLALQKLLDNPPKVKKVVQYALDDLIKAAKEGNQDAFDKRIAKAKASVFVINGASATKLFQWADKVRAAAWPDASEPKADTADNKKDAALQAAIDHLEEDKGQADIPPAEQKEDAALVAKLKEAQTAPAEPPTSVPEAAPKPKVVVTKPKAVQEPQVAPKPANPKAAKRVKTSQDVLAAKLDAMKLPTTNTNAKAVNGKIAKLEALVQAGDVAGLKAEKFGSNNYQKKLAKFAAEAVVLLEKANPGTANTSQAADDNDDDWLYQLFGPEPATDVTATVNGQVLKKIASGWEGPNKKIYYPGSPENLVASLLATGTVDTLMATASAKEQAVNMAIQHGVDPLKALNKIAANPDGLSNPYEGDTHVINGVTYQLINGRWHRVSPKDDADVTQAMKDAAINSLFDTQTPVKDLQQEWAKSLANGHHPTQHEAGAYELLNATEQGELVAAAVNQYLDKMSADAYKKLYKDAKDSSAVHVYAYVADQFLAKHHETLKTFAQANAASASAPPPAQAKTVTLYGEVFTYHDGAWYDDNDEGISEFSPNYLGLEVLAGQGPDPAWLKHFPETTVSAVAHLLHKEGADPAQIMNALFPKGQANSVSGDDYGEGAVYTLGLVDMVLKNGKWEVKKDDAPALAANAPGPQVDPVTAGHVDDPDFLGWYAAMLAGKTPTKPQMAAFAQALKDNTKTAVWAQQHLENTLGKATYDLQIKPHFPELYSKSDKADVLQDWVTSLSNGKAPTIKQALFYNSLGQDEQESLAYQALQDWAVDPDDDDAVDQAMDRLAHLQDLGLNGSVVKDKGGDTATASAVPAQSKNQVTLYNKTFTKKADGSWQDNGTGQPIQQHQTQYLALEALAGVKIPPQELKKWSLPSKLSTLEWVTESGMDGAEALNALFPPNSFHSKQTWPEEGDTKTIDGVTYVLQNGRWHRVTPTDAGNPDLTGADPDEVSVAGYTAALLTQKVPTPAQHQEWLNMLSQAHNGGQDIAQIVKEHTDLVIAAIGQEKYIQLLNTLHKQLQTPAAQPATPDTSWHNKVHDYLLNGVLGKISPSNTNYKTIKAKIEKYQKLLDAGKYDEILNTNWGSNNYAKKIANAHGIIKQHANVTSPPAATANPTVVLTQPIAATPDESESWAFDTSMQMGSNHGGLYTDKNGQKWYVKIPKSEAHARNELLAAKLYEAAGVAVPNLKLVKSGGKVAIASQWQDGMTKVGAGIKTATGALEGFAVDAWLANYDSVGTGYDNLLKDANGNAVRIDVGGSLLFRAQGAPKADFGDTVNELQGMLDPNKNSYSAAVFGGITDAQLKAGAAKVAAITPEQIKQMVQQYGPGTAAEKAALADRLIKRREDLLKKHPVAAAPKATAAPAAPVFRIPTPPDFKNWNGPGQGLSSKAAYNEQNQQLAETLYQKGLEGDVAAVENLTYQPITETGAPVGSPQSIKSHPSKHIPAYLKDVLKGMTQTYVSLSAQMAQVMTNVADNFKDLVQLFPGVKHLKDAAVKIGRYALLGKTDAAVFLAKWKKPNTVSKKQGTLSNQALFDQSQANFQNLSAVEQQAIKDYTGSGYTAMNNALIAGKKHDKAFNCIKGLEKASVPIPAGAVISRYCEFDKAEDGTESMENHNKAMKTLLKAGEGAILQEFGIISTSTNSTTWSGRVHLKITVGEGVKGLYVAKNPKGGHPPPISLNPSENEIMLPYGTQFMVTKIHNEKHEFEDATGTWGGNGATRVIEILALPNADINMLSN